MSKTYLIRENQPETISSSNIALQYEEYQKLEEKRETINRLEDEIFDLEQMEMRLTLSEKDKKLLNTLRAQLNELLK